MLFGSCSLFLIMERQALRPAFGVFRQDFIILLFA